MLVMVEKISALKAVLMAKGVGHGENWGAEDWQQGPTNSIRKPNFIIQSVQEGVVSSQKT